jgi:hypothetical protein
MTERIVSAAVRINVAATADLRRLPVRQVSTSRPNRAAAIAVPLDPIGGRGSQLRDDGLPVDKTFTMGVKLLPSFDLFNIFNAATVMGQRPNQNATNANQVFRFWRRASGVGLMVTF